MIRFIATLGFATGLATAAAAGAYETNVNTIIGRYDTTVIGQKFMPPKNPTVIFSSSTFAPGARTPVHQHPYPHYVCITQGALTIVRPDTGKDFTINSGSCFVEMIGVFHYGINKGAVPVKTMVVDQVPAGVEKNSVPMKPH